MINLSTQNFIPFLAPPLYPWRLRSIKEKRGVETDQDPEGPSQVQKPLYVFHFLFVGKKDFSILGFSCVPKSRLKQLMIKTVESQDSLLKGYR